MTGSDESSGRAEGNGPRQAYVDPPWFERALDIFQQAPLDGLHGLFANTDRTALRRAVQALVEAQSVFVVGLHELHPFAYLLQHVAATQLHNWRLLAWRDSELSGIAEALSPTDAVLGIEVPPYAADTIVLARCARDVGARVIAITDRPQWPLADCANNVLILPSGRHGVPRSGANIAAPVDMLTFLVTARSGSSRLAGTRHAVGSHTAASCPRRSNAPRMTDSDESSGRPAGAVVPRRADAKLSGIELELDIYRQAALDNLNALFGSIDRAALKRAAQALVEAQSVFVVGLNPDHPLASSVFDFAAMRFRNWRFPDWCDGELSRVAGVLTPADVVVAIAVHSYSTDAIAFARRARDVGTRVIAIIDRPQSPLADRASDVFLVPAPSPAVPRSLVGATAIVEMLLTLVAARSGGAPARSTAATGGLLVGVSRRRS